MRAWHLAGAVSNRTASDRESRYKGFEPNPVRLETAPTGLGYIAGVKNSSKNRKLNNPASEVSEPRQCPGNCGFYNTLELSRL